MFNNEAHAQQALALNDHFIGPRYVKVWMSSFDDMSNANFEKAPPKHRCKEITPALMDAVCDDVVWCIDVM